MNPDGIYLGLDNLSVLQNSCKQSLVDSLLRFEAFSPGYSVFLPQQKTPSVFKHVHHAWVNRPFWRN